MVQRRRPVVLCVLDGFGERTADDANAITSAKTPHLDALRRDHRFTTLAASGEAIGLEEDRPGRGDIGYATLGAGRVLPSLRSTVDQSIRDNELGRVPMIAQMLEIATYDKCPLHLIGLVSSGDNHAHLDHLFAMIDLAENVDVEVLVHAILDGRDTAPRASLPALERLQIHLEGKGKLATLSGRAWAMDRDGRWDRVYDAFRAIVRHRMLDAPAPRAEDAFDALSQAYSGETGDAQLVPTQLGDYTGMNGDFVCDFSTPTSPWEWTGEDVGFAFNLRGDRMHQLVALLTRQSVPDEIASELLMDRQYPVRAFREHCFTTMSDYHPSLASIPHAFPAPRVADTLAAVLAEAGLSQLRCGESERQHHLGFHFRGRHPEPHALEELRIVRTPALIDHYAEEPALSAAKVGAEVQRALSAGEHDFVLVSLPNADLLAHDGDFDACVQAVQAVDEAVGTIADAVKAAGAVLLVTSSHGAAEQHADEMGDRTPGHTTNRVPFLVAGDDIGALRGDGSLADVAPTILKLLGIEPPEAMTGRSLLEDDDG
ncbi:MAG TPA: phosphoglycerate mutase (2,3-diphosphoglycerate-independent) [Polyangiaceae bacterium]|nr:phosphoglycerate mutase (2,3-diphosphoglycerate-independent) [Polyangiaceae bacterium]